MIGHLYTLLLVGSGTAPPAPTITPAGRGRRTLAEWEADWAKRVENKPVTPKAKRRLKREAAREVYFDPLPDVAQAYIERLKAEQEAARLAEFRALLDLQVEASQVQRDIAHAALLMAQRQYEETKRRIEEFDVMYVAAILAEA